MHPSNPLTTPWPICWPRPQPLAGTDTVSTFDADGRVLAQAAISPLQVPQQDNSAMDGYAVRCADVPAGGRGAAGGQRIAAGEIGTPLAAGTAARIFTGAPVPPGADAIVMQEDCEALDDGQRVRVNAVPATGPVDAPRGRGHHPGRRGAGRRHAPDAGGAGPGGQHRAGAPCRWRAGPRVALFSTGDELVMPGEVPPAQMRPGAIYNSNRFFLRAMLQRLGCEVTDLGIVPDRLDATVAALREAAQGHDLILTSGGVSVGEEDHIKPAVESLGTLDLWQIAMKPGKPFAYGRIAGAHFMGLPGNPVSSFVTFGLLVRPFLLRLQGVRDVAPKAIAASAGFDWPRADKRREFLRVRHAADGTLELFANQSSGVLTSAAWADGVVDNPAGQTIARGDSVRFLPFAELLS